MKTSVRRHAARLLLSTAASLLGALALPAQAQVTPIGTGGVEVRGFLATNATTVYAAAYGGGLFRSTNAGVNWTRLALPGNDHYLTSIAGNTSSTITVGGDEGLYTSTDGINFTKRLSEPVAAVAMGTGASTTVLAGVKGVGIFRSTNSGVNFALANNAGLTGTDITAMAESPANANTFFVAVKPDGAGNRGGVFTSTDGGATWAATPTIDAAGGINHVFGLAVDGLGSAFAAVTRVNSGSFGGIYKLAGTWGLQSNTFNNISVHRDANVNTTMWGGGRNLGILRSVGGGAFNYAGGPGHGSDPVHIFYTAINAIASMPGNNTIALKAIKGAGVWRSTDANAGSPSWTRVTFTGAERVLSASHMATFPNSILLGLHAGGVWLSNDNGANWFPPTVNTSRADFSYAATGTAVSPFNSVWDIAASASNPNWIWVATGNVGMHYGNDNPGIFRWNGSAWQGVGSAPPSGAPWNIIQESGSIFLPSQPVYGVELNSGDDQALYASYLGSNFGSILRVSPGSWSVVSHPSTIPQLRSTISSVHATSRVIALPFDDKPVKSEGFGQNGSYFVTTVSQTGFERLRFFQAAESPTNAAIWVGATNKGIFYSTDSGTTWTRSTSANLQVQAMSAVGFKPSGRAFAGDRAGNRYCSADGGATWSRLTTGVSTFNAGVNSIRVVNGNLFYLTDGAGAQREDGSC